MFALYLLAVINAQTWLTNYPNAFKKRDQSELVVYVGNDTQHAIQFERMVEYNLARTDGFTDGEFVDAIEHYFWQDDVI